MPDTFGFGTDTTTFSSTVRDAIQKKVIATLRAGLIALPKGAVAPASVLARVGDNFTLRLSAYPDLDGEAATTLTEGVPPTPVKLAIDVLDFTVAQQGAFTKVTDLADFQSPHKLNDVAMDKIVRLAKDTIDRLARTALLAHAADYDDSGYGMGLNTSVVLQAKAALRGRDVQPVPGVGYYCVTHPDALYTLENESDLNGYVDVTSQVKAGDITAGAVSQYRGVTFITSTKFAADAVTGTFPAIFLGAESVAFGDVGTLEYHVTQAPDSANPLAQFGTYGFKGILGGKVIAMSETTDGAASTASPVDRVWRADVSSGIPA
jgi:hypothetical protein